MRRRLDAELVRRGLVRSRTAAAELIAAGLVTVSGARADKPARLVAEGEAITVAESSHYVSRGAHKLIGALEAFPDVAVLGRLCLDAGASTGGFTQVLLERGAAAVVAVDVGYGQLAWSLRTDPRVTVMDRTNVRTLRPEDLPWVPGVLVADLSFISLATVLPALTGCAAADADLLVMVKPQFEVGREALGSGGVVRDRSLRVDAVHRISAMAHTLGWGTMGVVASPLPGPSGNVEYFLHLRRGGAAAPRSDVEAAVAAGPQDAV